MGVVGLGSPGMETQLLAGRRRAYSQAGRELGVSSAEGHPEGGDGATCPIAKCFILGLDALDKGAAGVQAAGGSALQGGEQRHMRG